MHRTHKHRLACLTALLFTTAAASPPATTQTATTQPATTQTARRVDRLIRQLGDADYRAREAAQAALADLGDAALPHVVQYLDSDDPEIVSRLGPLIRRPADPDLRVELAVRLIETEDPDWIEPGVHMLFREPRQDYDRLVARTADATGPRRALFDPIIAQLAQWRHMTEMFHQRYEKLKTSDPDAARRMRAMHAESELYQAEAAYWTAVEGLVDDRERLHELRRARQRIPASQPHAPTADQPEK